jgi:hypothetical protein
MGERGELDTAMSCAKALHQGQKKKRKTSEPKIQQMEGDRTTLHKGLGLY